MSVTPYALSVHHFISTVGADAGFAAIIGLAIVVLLFFAHARETANLRHRATEAEDALHRLEQYVDQLARAGVAPAPASAPAVAPAVAPAAARVAPAPAAARAGAGAPVAARTPSPTPAPVGMMAGAPSAPAGVGAPALSAATRLIPAAESDPLAPISIRSNRATGAEGSATGATAAAVMDPPAPPPSTTAGGANGGAVRYPPPAAAAAAAGGETMGGRERLGQRPGPNRPVAAGAGRRRGQRPGGRIGRGAMVLAAGLVVVVVVGALLVLTNSGGGSGSKSPSSSQRASQATNSASSARSRKSKAAAAVTPASVTVAVLNGTSTTNLAHDISSKLQSAGYKQGTIATATNQTQSATIVGYLPNDKPDALAVAKSLKLAPRSVQAVDPNNRSLACNGSASSCPAQVVVTVGTDLASNA